MKDLERMNLKDMFTHVNTIQTKSKFHFSDSVTNFQVQSVIQRSSRDRDLLGRRNFLNDVRRPLGRRLRGAAARQRPGPPGLGRGAALPHGGPREAQPDHAAAEPATGTSRDSQGGLFCCGGHRERIFLDVNGFRIWENEELK